LFTGNLFKSKLQVFQCLKYITRIVYFHDVFRGSKYYKKQMNKRIVNCGKMYNLIMLFQGSSVFSKRTVSNPYSSHEANPLNMSHAD